MLERPAQAGFFVVYGKILVGLVVKKPKPYEIKRKVRYGVISLDFKEDGELIYVDGKIKKK